MRVETASPPTTVRLRLRDVCADSVVEVLDEHSTWLPVPIDGDKADLVTPFMRGGYDERRGKQSNVSDPARYPVIRLRGGAGRITELSLQDVNALPKDADGRAVVSVHCDAAPVVGPSG